MSILLLILFVVDLKAGYKQVEKKLFNEKQGMLQEIVTKIKEKEGDSAKLLQCNTVIEEKLTQLQNTFGNI